jgi:hypothetical protein
VLGVRSVRVALAATCTLVWLLFCGPAAAVDNSELEERCVVRALGKDFERDPAPQGKRIESLEIARLPVFDEDDPIPDFVNVFHWQTRESAIRRELLFQAGDVYNPELVQETIRNLQLLPQFGVVVVVALKGKTPDSVRVVVVVRDVWTLRLNYQLQGTFKSINYLLINPTEDNLFGTRTSAGALFALQPDRYQLGGLVLHPRIAGSKVDAVAHAGVFINLESGKAEGSTGALALRRDLIALSDEWSFLAGASWLVEQTRLYSDRRLVRSEQGIPIEYHTSILLAGAQVTRSFGRQLKFNLTWGIQTSRRAYEATQGVGVTDQAFAGFVHDELPVSDRRISPFVQLEHFPARYLVTHDVETLALQESIRLGQYASVRVYPAARSLGSSRDLVGSVAWLGYTWALGDGVARAIAGSGIEAADQGKHQASAQGQLRLVSPRLGFGRAVLDGAFVSAYENYLNRKVILGGDTRPRGYVSQAFRGASGAAASFELRTSAVNLFSARVGAVAFYDLGGAGPQLTSLTLHQSVGAGVRVLLPYFNREVFRLDWAAPLTPGRGRIPDAPLPGGVYFTFGQAFDMPYARLSQLLSSDGTVLDAVQ